MENFVYIIYREKLRIALKTVRECLLRFTWILRENNYGERGHASSEICELENHIKVFGRGHSMGHFTG